MMPCGNAWLGTHKARITPAKRLLRVACCAAADAQITRSVRRCCVSRRQQWLQPLSPRAPSGPGQAPPTAPAASQHCARARAPTPSRASRRARCMSAQRSTPQSKALPSVTRTTLQSALASTPVEYTSAVLGSAKRRALRPRPCAGRHTRTGLAYSAARALSPMHAGPMTERPKIPVVNHAPCDKQARSASVQVC